MGNLEYNQFNESTVRRIVQQEMAKRDSSARFNLNSIPNHTHNGVDSLQVKEENLIPSVSVSGRITFAQETDYVLNLNANFTPSTVSLYGVAYSTRVQYTFNSDELISATSGTVYTQGGVSYTVVNTVVNSFTIVMYGSSDPSSSGNIQRVIGDGEFIITYTSYSASSSASTRAMIIGSANLGPSFYFQPDSATSVKTGNIEYPFIDPNINGGTTVPLQSSMYFLATNTSTTFRGQPGEGHIVDVQYSGTIYARATITTFDKTKVVFHVSDLASGWEIYTNIVIT